MSDFDYEGYSKSLEKVLDGVTKDFWASYIDVNRHQVGVARTYLWVSAALLGAYVAVFEKLKEQILTSPSLLFIGVIAFMLSCFAFGIFLYSIPSRRGYKTIPESGWGEFSNEAYNLTAENNCKVYPAFLSSLISKYDYAFEHNFSTNQVRAKMLRITSWLLVGSFSAAIFVTGGSALNFLIHHQPTHQVIKMSQENKNTQSKQQNSKSAPVLQVPVPPPSANIKSGQKTIHAFDSAESIRASLNKSENKY